MKKIKNNKVLLVLAIILLICFILIIVALFKYFYTGDNKNKYGERLEQIESHKLKENLESEIKKIYREEEINKVEIKTSGRIIYLTLDISKVMKISDARSLALKSLDKFSDDEKKYYDIQFIITCESEGSSENKIYPTMGYKNSASSIVVWIKG